MILSSECFVADVAHVGSFVSVRAFVDEQIVTFCEVPVIISLYQHLAVGLPCFQHDKEG